jgi:hypothetical protein
LISWPHAGLIQPGWPKQLRENTTAGIARPLAKWNIPQNFVIFPILCEAK